MADINLADLFRWLVKQPIWREPTQDDYTLAGPGEGGDGDE